MVEDWNKQMAQVVKDAKKPVGSRLSVRNKKEAMHFISSH